MVETNTAEVGTGSVGVAGSHYRLKMTESEDQGIAVSVVRMNTKALPFVITVQRNPTISAVAISTVANCAMLTTRCRMMVFSLVFPILVLSCRHIGLTSIVRGAGSNRKISRALQWPCPGYEGEQYITIPSVFFVVLSKPNAFHGSARIKLK